MKRAILSTILMASLVCSMMGFSVYADNKNDETKSVIETKSALKVLEKKYNIIITDAENMPNRAGSGSEHFNLIKFNTIREFEEFVKDMKKTKVLPTRKTGKMDILINDFGNNSVLNASRATFYGNDRVSWWAPFSGWGLNGVACWRNIDFSFSYTNRSDGRSEFVSVSNISSYVSGFTMAPWTQTSSSSNIRTVGGLKNNVKLKVNGYHQLAVSVQGVPVGATIPGAWEASYDLAPQN